MSKREVRLEKKRCPGAKPFGEQFPEIGQAYDQLVSKCEETGPLNQKTKQLIKIAVAAAGYLQNAIKANTARAIRMGIPQEEIEQAILLTMPTVGYPKMVAALNWSREITGGELFR